MGEGRRPDGRLHLSPNTSSDRLVGYPERCAFVIEPSGQLAALEEWLPTLLSSLRMQSACVKGGSRWPS